MIDRDVWRDIAREYIEGDLSLRDLAVKRGVSYPSIQRKSISGGWVAQRAAFRRGQDPDEAEQVEQRRSVINSVRTLREAVLGDLLDRALLR